MPSWDDLKPREAPPLVDETAAMCFRLLSSGEGENFMKWLRSITKERALGPEASFGALAHLEGQRQLVAQIEAHVERGREQAKAR